MWRSFESPFVASIRFASSDSKLLAHLMCQSSLRRFHKEYPLRELSKMFDGVRQFLAD